MQPVIAAPRAGLAATAVTGIITTSPSVTVAYGADWIDSQFNYVQDISEWLLPGGTISSDITATIHRSCSLSFSEAVPTPYLADFVRPTMTMTDNDTGIAATFHLGVYTLASTNRDASTEEPVLDFTGYDLLQLLAQPLSDSYEVQAGSDPAAAAATLIQSVLPDAHVVYTDSDVTLVSQVTWVSDGSSSDPTYLDMVNTLISAIGYTPLWVDWDGVFRIEPWVDPTIAPYEWSFDLDGPDNIVAEPRTSTIDLFDTPNWWRFVMADLPDTPVEGATQVTIINSDPSSPSSVVNRGGREVKRLYSVPATTYDALVQAAAVQVALDSATDETFTVASYPLPLAWHRDVLLYKDERLASAAPSRLPQRRVLASKWNLTMDESTDMTWVWQTIAAV